MSEDTVLGVVVVMFAVTIGLLVYYIVVVRRADRVSRAVEEKAVDENEGRRQSYVRHIFNICSAYLRDTEYFTRTAVRKLRGAQYNDLLRLLESGKLVREQQGEFSAVFDNAFLEAYPDFVQRVNALLVPDKRIPVPESGLNTELRLLAFYVLGIDDASKVSKFTGLSVNTIYTYRNKLKNKAIDRAHFEEQLKDLRQGKARSLRP